MTYCVHRSMKPVQATRIDPGCDLVAGQAESDQLPVANDAVLACGEFCDLPVKWMSLSRYLRLKVIHLSHSAQDAAELVTRG